MSQPGLDLTKGNLLKNLVRLAAPIVFSNFLQTFYNLTDAFWLGKLGENARNAVSVAGMTFPLVFFLSSFGFGFVVAGTSLISQYKGAGMHEKMKEVVGQFILILSIFSVIFILGSFIFLDQILYLLQTPSEIYLSAKEYISIILSGMIFMFIFLSYQSFSHGLGDTISPMKIQIISVSINVVLDPILIFGISFFPRMEIKGAAIATLIARIIAALIAIYYLVKKSPHILPKMKNLIPDLEMIRKILKISIPASMGFSMTSFGFLVLQGFVNSFGTVVISIFSIGNRMIGLFMMPAMGISSALASIIGQNLGAKQIRRAEKSVWVAFKLTLMIMTIGCFILFFFGASLTRFFINDAAVIEVGRRMFKVTSIAAFVFGNLFVFMGVFNGSGHTKPSMILNIARLWFFRIPLVFILSGKIISLLSIKWKFLLDLFSELAQPLSAFPYDALWWSMLISNLLASIWAYAIFRKGKWKQAKIYS